MARTGNPDHPWAVRRRDRSGWRRPVRSVFPKSGEAPPAYGTRQNDESYIEVSPSVTEGPDEEELTGILDACELTGFTLGTALVFENAIERLYYSDSR